MLPSDGTVMKQMDDPLFCGPAKATLRVVAGGDNTGHDKGMQARSVKESVRLCWVE